MEVLYSKRSASSKSGSSTPSVSTVSWLHQKIYFPLSQVHRVGRNHLGWGLNWRCLEEKGKLPIPDPTRLSSPFPPPCQWEGDTRTNANKSLLYLAIIECLLDARSFYRQWKYVGQDPALGRCSLNVADRLLSACTANGVSILGDSAPFN